MVQRLKLGDNVSEQNLRDLKDTTDSSANTIISIVNDIVRSCCQSLDELVSIIQQELQETDEIPDIDLNYYVAQLPVEMYYVSSKLEDVGIKMDTTSAVKKEKYDMKYLASEGKTINEKQSDANREVVEEELLEAAYQRAYKKMKSRLDYADSILNSLKKVLNYRIAAMELSNKSNYNGGDAMGPRNRRSL